MDLAGLLVGLVSLAIAILSMKESKETKKELNRLKGNYHQTRFEEKILSKLTEIKNHLAAAKESDDLTKIFTNNLLKFKAVLKNVESLSEKEKKEFEEFAKSKDKTENVSMTDINSLYDRIQYLMIDIEFSREKNDRETYLK